MQLARGAIQWMGNEASSVSSKRLSVYTSGVSDYFQFSTLRPAISPLLTDGILRRGVGSLVQLWPQITEFWVSPATPSWLITILTMIRAPDIRYYIRDMLGMAARLRIGHSRYGSKDNTHIHRRVNTWCLRSSSFSSQRRS